MNARDVIAELGEISRSTAPAAELEARLAAVSVRESFRWSYSETVEIERMAGEVRRRIGVMRAAETRRTRPTRP